MITPKQVLQRQVVPIPEQDRTRRQKLAEILQARFDQEQDPALFQPAVMPELAEPAPTERDGPVPSGLESGGQPELAGAARAFFGEGNELSTVAQPANFPADQTERGNAARDYLITNHGLTPHAAAAVVGHGIQESNLRPSGAVGDNGTAHGMFQWRGDRFVNLQRFAQSQGKDWRDFNTQLDFVAHELGGSERYAGEALRNAQNLEDATAAFMHFERPAGYSRGNPTGGHGYNNRLNYARQFLTDGTGANELTGNDGTDGFVHGSGFSPEREPDPAPVPRRNPLRSGPPPVPFPRPGFFSPSNEKYPRVENYGDRAGEPYNQRLNAPINQRVASAFDAIEQPGIPQALERGNQLAGHFDGQQQSAPSTPELAYAADGQSNLQTNPQQALAQAIRTRARPASVIVNSPEERGSALAQHLAPVPAQGDFIQQAAPGGQPQPRRGVVNALLNRGQGGPTNGQYTGAGRSRVPGLIPRILDQRRMREEGQRMVQQIMARPGNTYTAEQLNSQRPDILREILLTQPKSAADLEREQLELGALRRKVNPGKVVQLTPEEEVAAGLNPDKAYQRKPDGTITEIGGGGNNVTTNVGGNNSKGWQKIDENFHPHYFEWQGGGFADTVKQITQLNDALRILESGEAITGAWIGSLPEMAQPFFNPNGVIAKDRVTEVVQRSLRTIFGAQFTAQDGERLIERAYNDKLPPPENARRVRALLQQITTMGEAKQSMVDHFQEHGTLQGFKGKVPSLAEVHTWEFGAKSSEAGSAGTAEKDTGRLKSTKEKYGLE